MQKKVRDLVLLQILDTYLERNLFLVLTSQLPKKNIQMLEILFLSD